MTTDKALQLFDDIERHLTIMRGFARAIDRETDDKIIRDRALHISREIDKVSDLTRELARDKQAS